MSSLNLQLLEKLFLCLGAGRVLHMSMGFAPLGAKHIIKLLVSRLGDRNYDLHD
jgi:hypothetical protein